MRNDKQHCNTLTPVAAAARALISERSAWHIDYSDTSPQQRQAPSWHTREDPLTEVWDAEVAPLLRTAALPNAVMLLEQPQRRHHGQYDVRVQCALQRCIRQWRALHGAERDIYFAKEHPPAGSDCPTAPSAANWASRSTAIKPTAETYIRSTNVRTSA